MYENLRVLAVDDDPVTCSILERILNKCDCKHEIIQSSSEALKRIERDKYDLLITDLKMPEFDGMKIMKETKKKSPDTHVIMITGFSTVESAVEAMKLGAYDYIRKPIDPDELLLIVERALENKILLDENRLLKEELAERFSFESIIGQHPRMMQVFEVVKKISQSRSNVIICGESGTGKELIARAIHYNGPRRKNRFIAVNCGAIPDNLLENELFGHEKGAFTGAYEQKKGLIEAADGGTLFLDEIGNISEPMQVRLLRVIQEKNFFRVGGTVEVKVDVRFISATNQDIERLVEDGRFREDLFHRLNVVTISLPPLRERREDIPLLINHFIKKFNHYYGKEIKGVTEDVLKVLMGYEWKGNIRELENVIERAITLMDGDTIEVSDLPAYILKRGDAKNIRRIPTLKELEKEHILRILKETDGDRNRAAELLGIDKTTLWRKIRRYNI
ncbi:MAG: sigma-54-dependent Fis family transcriptional regulator [Nitrospirae bacterium]|nr:sigma-54-dependent Fis family transcriptional regulator [Nitrospirota bacterium]